MSYQEECIGQPKIEYEFECPYCKQKFKTIFPKKKFCSHVHRCRYYSIKAFNDGLVAELKLSAEEFEIWRELNGKS